MTAAWQQTLRREVECTGIGLHGGREVRVRLLPARPGTGIVFRCRPSHGSAARCVEIPASAEAVGAVDHATTLVARADGGTIRLQTVEHVLAALRGLDVDNAIVEVHGSELPILDGSSAQWVALLQRAGLRAQAARRLVRRITRPVTVSRGTSSVSVYPSVQPRITCSIDFRHPSIGHQECSVVLSPAVFASEIAPARTFGFLRDVEALRESGLALGGSAANAIVLDDDGILNGDLRFADEFVRHKALDLLGDLALTGLPLAGHVVARRAGHALHVEFARHLLRSDSCWRIEGTDARRAHPTPPALVGAAALVRADTV